MSAQEWLDRTQEITERATAGPWSFFEDTRLDGMPVYRIGSNETGEDICSVPRYRYSDDGEREAEFIAHARTALPQAVAALQAVTDLHQPRSAVTQSASGHLVDTLGPCTACDWDWPCPTVTTIQDTLGDHQ